MNRIGARSLVHLVVLILIVIASSAPGYVNRQVESDRSLKCFHLSGPLWALLRYKLTDLNLCDVDRLLDARLSSGHPTMTAMLDVAQQLGFRLRKFRSERTADCRVPCLVVVHRDSGGPVEHEVLLAVSSDPSAITVFRFRDLGGWEVVSHEELASQYAGWGIMFDRRRQIADYFLVTGWWCLGALAVAFTMWYFRRKTAPDGRQRTLAQFTLPAVICVAMIPSGCHGKTDGLRPVPKFGFAETAIDLGSLEQNEVRTFEVVLKDPADAKWQGEFVVDCGCVQLPTIRLRSQVSLDQHFVLPVQVSTGRQVGPQKHYIRFQGRSDHGSIVDSTCEIRYDVSAAPFSEPSQLVMTRLYGQPEWIGEVRIVFPRLADAPVACLDRESSRLNTLRLEVLDASTVMPTGPRSAVDDIFRLRFSLANSAFEPEFEHSELRFTPSNKTVTIPVVYQSRHPIRVDPPGFFLGRCQANSVHHKQLLLVNLSDAPISGTVNWSGGGTAEYPVELTLEVGNNSIPVVIETGSCDGRQSAQLVFVPESAEIPDLFIEFSWVSITSAVRSDRER